MSDIYRVEKEELAVELTMTDGAVIRGSVFLSSHSKVHGGRQTMEELLDDEGHFLPLNDSAGGFKLAGKAGLVSVRAKASEERELEFTKRIPVSLRAAGVGGLEGELVTPEVSESFRVSDYLNGDYSNWLRVESGGDIFWIKKSAVLELAITGG